MACWSRRRCSCFASYLSTKKSCIDRGKGASAEFIIESLDDTTDLPRTVLMRLLQILPMHKYEDMGCVSLLHEQKRDLRNQYLLPHLPTLAASEQQGQRVQREARSAPRSAASPHRPWR